MSIATKQLHQSLHNPNRQQEQQSARTFIYKEQQNNRIKSIDTTIESQVEHVTKKVIKSKQLLRQKPVAATESEKKPQNKKSNKSQSQETEDKIVKELEDSYTNEQEGNDCEAKNYQVYQNGKVKEFFKKEMLEKPKKISDICLVNDHYILVKMPQQEITTTNNNLAEAAVRRKEFRALKEHNDKLSKESQKQDNKKLCRYLRRKRNCVTRIAPIHEEPEELSDNENKTVKTNSKLYCLQIKSCWQANEQEVETYQTKTTICKSIKTDSCNQQKSNNQQSSPSKPATEKPKCFGIQKPPDIQTISGSVLKSSLQYRVSLHNYGSLIDSSNKNNLEMSHSPPRRKCPRFESFYWLLRPFRGKYCKTKPKIQAVVYKTYFVKWTKPPDTLSHGYGVKSSKSSDLKVSVLRRCRSAIF